MPWGTALGYVILPAVLVAPIFELLFDFWLEDAARANQEEFERADSNSMNAWKHFP
jgi:hypothetical protein